ncbi:hypothetical protein [Lactobacillus delbrueckii]|uniref:hypothetical protein n=1 Tax=Lactobacillus delbrueckii TaxID=1584 RepID=UPI003A847D89
MSRKQKTATIVTVFCFENILRLHTLKGKVAAFRVRKIASFGTAHINDFTNNNALAQQLLAGLRLLLSR